jgi:hypothetical protein
MRIFAVYLLPFDFFTVFIRANLVLAKAGIVVSYLEQTTYAKITGVR